MLRQYTTINDNPKGLDKACRRLPLDIALDPVNLNLHQGSQFYISAPNFQQVVISYIVTVYTRIYPVIDRFEVDLFNAPRQPSSRFIQIQFRSSISIWMKLQAPTAIFWRSGFQCKCVSIRVKVIRMSKFMLGTGSELISA